MPHGSSTAAHRDKRQFQPSITSYFAREGRDDYDNDDEGRGPGPLSRTQQRLARDRNGHGYGYGHNSLIPPVPATVQSDLLSVGMRVRKSVPEGYKTHKTNSGVAALPSIQTTLAKATNSGDAYSVKPPREAVPEVLQHQRELLPFCGLHKIGGFAEQPVTNIHLYGGADEGGDRPVNLFPLPAEAFNQPFSLSQESSISVDSLPPNPQNPHKRSWTDESSSQSTLLGINSNFLFALPMKVSEDEVPVSPLSETPTQSLPKTALRPFAQPKTRRQPGRMVEVDAAVFKESDVAMDLENAEQAEDPIVGSSSDFGEAEFLRPWGGREVEMGGV
jgi:hypothetical protein